MTTPPKKYQVFREPKNVEEFEQMLRLRFEVFSEKGETTNFEPTSAALGLDLNAYDICSIHFGLFECDDAGGEQLIGTIRFIDAVAQPRTEAWVRAILTKYEDLSWEVLKVPSEPFAVKITRQTHAEKSTQALFSKYRTKDQKVLEISRLALLKEVRGRSFAQKFIEVGYSMAIIYERAVFAAGSDHLPLYQPYLVYPIFIAGEFEYGNTKKTIVFADKQTLSLAHWPKIEKMAAALRDTGQIVFRDDLPGFRLPEM